jgi:hypothetical protein
VTAAAAPLARSLTPLPGEGLPGYVLRLAHRLGRPPARIAALTGLPANSRSGALAHPMLTMDPQTAATFGTVTRLDPPEVAALCMDRYAERYPPLNLTTRSPVPRVMAITRRGWALVASTRYCPQCLAGDGSPIQQRHGGAWQQRWRLQVVFACITHQRLLEYLCPECATPAGTSRALTSIALLPRLHDQTLHPAQCRGNQQGQTLRSGSRSRPAVCGAWLDTATGHAGDALHETLNRDLLQLQARILDRLEPGGPVEPADARRYFDLLPLVHNLVMLTWPEALHLAGPGPFGTAAGAHVARARHAVGQARAAARPFTVVNPPMRKLPPEPGASAGLLLAADRILGWDDPAGLQDRLMPLAETAAREPQAWYWLRTRQAWPSAVRRSFLPHRKGFTVPARRTGKPPIPPRQFRFRAEHIPQRLPGTWCDQHLAHLPGISLKHLRRAAALKLVELTSGHAWPQAAELLQFPRHIAECAIRTTRRWIRDPASQRDFDHAIEALARELDAISPHTDYATRRHALQDWSMPDTHWKGFIHEMETQTASGSGRRHTISGRKQEIVSVLAWTRITQGEHLYAPLVLADKISNAGAPPRTARLAAQAGEVLHSKDPDDYSTLRRITTSYADRLADHIDRTATADHFDWSPATPTTAAPAPRRKRRTRNTQTTGPQPGKPPRATPRSGL